MNVCGGGAVGAGSDGKRPRLDLGLCSCALLYTLTTPPKFESENGSHPFELGVCGVLLTARGADHMLTRSHPTSYLQAPFRQLSTTSRVHFEGYRIWLGQACYYKTPNAKRNGLPERISPRHLLSPSAIVSSISIALSLLTTFVACRLMKQGASPSLLHSTIGTNAGVFVPQCYCFRCPCSSRPSQLYVIVSPHVSFINHSSF